MWISLEVVWVSVTFVLESKVNSWSGKWKKTDVIYWVCSFIWYFTVIGECNVTLKKAVQESVQWARLEDSCSMKVKDFISSLYDGSLHSNQSHNYSDSQSHDGRLDGNQSDKGFQQDNPSQNGLYLFDWSLPVHCPKLAQELTIPKYFAGIARWTSNITSNISLLYFRLKWADYNFSMIEVNCTIACLPSSIHLTIVHS